MAADRHRTTCHNKHCWGAFKIYQHW